MSSFWDSLHAYSERWHDLWEIIGALGAAGAVIVALLLAWRENRARQKTDEELKIERQRREQIELLTLERGQQEFARFVAVWTNLELSEDQHDDSHTQVILNVGNYSNAPVFDIFFGYESAANQIELFSHLGEHFDSNFNNTARTLPSLNPGQVITVRLPHLLPSGRPATTEKELIMFRDIRGALWFRFADGRLQKYKSEIAIEPTAF